MGREASGRSIFQTLVSRLRPRREPADALPAFTPLGMLQRLHAGEHPDYCLYVRPPAGGAVCRQGPLSVDLEELLAQALNPLPMLTLDEYAAVDMGSALPDEAFLTLANRARLLCLAPTSDAHFIKRLRMIKSLGPFGRCVFLMPENGTLGAADWPAIWPAAREKLSPLSIDLSGYTAGGWLFRVDKEGKAVTFRPIVNPNPEKIARALEGICVEMD